MLQTTLLLVKKFNPLKYIYLFLLLPINVFASNNNEVSLIDIFNKAQTLVLWEHTEWLNLVHYQKEFYSYVSQVDDERFFYAQDGKTNPEQELLETIKHLFIYTENHNQQTQCRFIARSEWLIKQLSIDKASLPIVHCEEYQQWRKLAEADSVTMIFPAYHLNSPSSMFGHTLLRLDNSKNADSEWLSFAVNFGADINNDDNSLLYAFRGLAGGYPGIFITEPYFKKIQEYNRIEHRDIWEYKLNLSAEETDRMIKHIWELKTINFDYYFFDENCSYRLLELIEVARPAVELTDEFILTAIPVDTVRAIERAQLIESVRYRPARATQIQFSLDEMSDQNRHLIKQLSVDFNVTKSKEFNSLSDSEQKKIVDLAYKYLRHINTKQARDPATAKLSFLLLQKLNSYSPDISTDAKIPTPTPPEKSHESKRMTLAVGERLDNQYAEFGFKMAFHDLEDNKDGFLQGAQINMINIKLRAEENEGLRLYQLDVIDIFSLTPRNAFFSPLSWKIYSGFERQLTKNKDQLTLHITGGAGGTWSIIKSHQFYALAIFRLENNKQLRNTLEAAIGFNSGFLFHFNKTTAHLQFSGEHFEENIYRLRAQYTQNFVLSTNHSIKLFAGHQWQENNTEFSDINFSYQYYF